MRKILIIVLVLVFSRAFNANAQQKIDFATVDAKTYSFYENGQWDSLIDIGEIAIKNGIDYFYLRLRMGIAYYEKTNYVAAGGQFEKAKAFNSGDMLMLEYLYFSYKFSGREADAEMIAGDFSEELKNKLNISNNKFKIKFVELAGSGIMTDNFSKNENFNFVGNNELAGGAVLSGNTTAGNIGLKLQFGKNVSVYQSFSMLSQEKKSILAVTEFKPDGRIINTWDTAIWHPFPPPPYQTFDTIIENRQKFSLGTFVNKNDTYLKQQEYYLNINISGKKGLTISPFVHLLNVSYTQFYNKEEKKKFIATDYVETHTQFHYPPMLGGAIVDTVFYYDTTYTVDITEFPVLQKDTSFVNYCLGASFNKRFKKTDVSLFGSFSNLNGLKQKQIGTSLTFYPKGNLNLYFNFTATLFAQKKSSGIITSVLGGFKAAKKLWLEANATIGDITNFTELNGALVYNNPDVIKLRAGITSFILFKNFDIILRYSFYQKEALFYKYNESGKYIEKIVPYSAQLISGGIKWKF